MSWFHKNKKRDNPRKRPESNKRAVFSYYARGASSSDQNTGRNEDVAKSAFKRYGVRLVHIPSYVAFLAVVIALAYSCMLTPDPKIILVNTPDTVHRESKVYQESIKAIWQKSLLNRTKLTVSTDGMEREIKNQFAELSNVQIELPLLGRRPSVILTPQKPTLQMVSANGSFYVDSGGKVMARIPDLVQNDLKNLPLIRDETSNSAEVGKVVLPATEAQFLNKLYYQLRAENIDVQSITLPPKAANEADVRVAGLPYYIKFSIESDPRQAVGTYLAAKTKLDKEGTTPAEYIDVRVEEKVFFR